MSEVQEDEKIIPAIADLGSPLVMSSQLGAEQGNTRAAKVSWDLKRVGTVGDEGAPLPSEELKRSGALFCSRNNALRSRQGHRRNCG